MTKTKWLICLLAVLVCTLPLVAQAAQASDKVETKHCKYRRITAALSNGELGDEALWWQDGNKKFKKNCMNCHRRKNDVGASFLHVESRTQSGWDKVFVERYPQCAQDGSWDSLTEKELRDINDYLCRYAYGTAGVYESFFS